MFEIDKANLTDDRRVEIVAGNPQVGVWLYCNHRGMLLATAKTASKKTVEVNGQIRQNCDGIEWKIYDRSLKLVIKTNTVIEKSFLISINESYWETA